MGGLFGLMYAALYPNSPLKNLVCAATPVDMNGMGLFRKWVNPRYFDVDRLVDTVGNIPPELMLRSFEMLRPMDRWGGYIRLIDNLWDPQFAYGFRIVQVTNEQIPFPGEVHSSQRADVGKQASDGQMQLGNQHDPVNQFVLHARPSTTHRTLQHAVDRPCGKRREG
jgi:polyhydroxyalkanoate synthase